MQTQNNILKRAKQLTEKSFVRFLLTVAAIILLIFLFTRLGLWMHSK